MPATPFVVSDTSPLQYLHQLGLLEMLPRVYAPMLLPPDVLDELAAGHALGADLPRVDAIPWIAVREPELALLPREALALGKGERAVLALALGVGADLVLLDDAEGRRWARRLGLPVTGTVGVLIALLREGLLPELRPEMARLQSLGFWLDESIVAAALRLAGEAQDRPAAG